MSIAEHPQPIRANRCSEGWSDRLSREAAANQELRRALFGTSRARRTRERSWQPGLPYRKPQFRYNAQGRMLTLTDARGITYLTNEYDSAGRVSKQTQADGGTYQFAYTTSNGTITQTTVTDPNGKPQTTLSRPPVQ
jgi:YD repeat-containing protein